jgi:small subunit ribosomal protein S20
MANTSAAKKEMRSAGRRAFRNRSVRSAVKTRIVKARRALTEGAEGAVEAALLAISSLDRAAEKGIVHPKNAARRKSRLARRMNAQGATPAAPAKGQKAKATRGAGKTTAKPPAKAAGAKATAAKPAAKSAPKSAPARKSPAKKA